MFKLYDINFDQSIYYAIASGLKANGFVDASGSLTIRMIDGDVNQYLIENVSEQEAGITPDDEATILPAISIEDNEYVSSPAALGGAQWRNRSYTINVFGKDPSHSKEIAETIERVFSSGIYVYDFNMGPPTTSGFPLSGQYLGHFSVNSLRNQRVTLPSYSILDSVRREVSFEIISLKDI